VKKSPNRIRQRREELGLTQAELAKKLGISTTYLSKIENERKPINVVLAIRIAKALESTVEEIFLTE
jgi:DNA-binding XRE family transcriptional regulator